MKYVDPDDELCCEDKHMVLVDGAESDIEDVAELALGRGELPYLRKRTPRLDIENLKSLTVPQQYVRRRSSSAARASQPRKGATPDIFPKLASNEEYAMLLSGVLRGGRNCIEGALPYVSTSIE
jgi:hypothetical protein